MKIYYFQCRAKYWTKALAMAAGMLLHKLRLRTWTTLLERRIRRHRALRARRL